MTDTMTDESQLQAQLAEARAAAAAAEKQLEAIAMERDEIARERRDEWFANIIEHHIEWDAELEAEQAGLQQVFETAARAGDLQSAINAWIDQRAIHVTRQQLRSHAQSGEELLQTTRRILPDLSYRQTDLLAAVERFAELESGDRGFARAAELFGNYRDED